MRFVPRHATNVLRGQLSAFPCALLLGPRQCGKSTLAARHCRGWKRLDLDRSSDFGVLANDIEGFLEANPRRVLIDEAQRLPALFPALRHALDRGRGAGRYLLLGSASPPLMKTASESLAGRVGMVELAPQVDPILSGRAVQA